MPKLLFRRYVPYYYLGAAWYESGNCDEALKALEESQLQGVITDMPEFYDLQRKRRKCEARSNRVTALEKAQESIERATAASAQVAELQRNPELASVWTWRENSLDSRQERAEQLLEEARSTLARDPQRMTTGQLQEAGEKAAQARWQLEAIRVEASQHLGEVRELIGQERQRLDDLLRKASQARSAAEALRPWPEGVSSRVVILERAVRRARRVRDEAVADTLVAARSDLEEAIAALGRATSPPPRVLEQGVQAYFDGDYEKAVEQLGAARVSGRRALAHLYLLRSAARYALFRAGDQDPELLTQARRDARLCRQQDSALEPSATLFSPGFVDFFRFQSRVNLDRPDG
jgi:tetratricopeptide (TPR) repeat protein